MSRSCQVINEEVKKCEFSTVSDDCNDQFLRKLCEVDDFPSTTRVGPKKGETEEDYCRRVVMEVENEVAFLDIRDNLKPSGFINHFILVNRDYLQNYNYRMMQKRWDAYNGQLMSDPELSWLEPWHAKSISDMWRGVVCPQFNKSEGCRDKSCKYEYSGGHYCMICQDIGHGTNTRIQGKRKPACPWVQNFKEEFKILAKDCNLPKDRMMEALYDYIDHEVCE